MKYHPISKLLIAAIVFLGGWAQATILLNDNFDSYANQAAFLAAWPLATASGTLSTAQAVSAPNSVNFGTAAARNSRAFAESGNPSTANAITFSFDFYDSNAAINPYRQVAQLIDGAGTSSS
jgi:hypothetical protein